MSNWILKAARAQGFKQLVIALILLTLISVMMLINRDYIREYFRGPHIITAADLSAGNNKAQGWVKLQADVLHNTGIQEITVRKKRGVERGRSVSALYYIAEVGNKFLLVKGVEGQSKALQGTFVPLEGKLAAEVFKSPEMQAMRSQFYPQVIDTHDYDDAGSTWLPVGGLAALAVLVWGAIGLKRYRKPETHPAVKPFVEAGTLKAAGASIQRSVSGKKFLKHGDTLLTQEYAVSQTMLKLSIHPLDELLWAYKQVTQQKLYYVIPAGKTCAANLNFAKGSLKLSGKEAKVEEALEYAATRAPWAILGYDDDMAALYKKQRVNMIDFIKRRKEEYLKQQQASAQSSNTTAATTDATSSQATPTASRADAAAPNKDLPPLDFKP